MDTLDIVVFSTIYLLQLKRFEGAREEGVVGTGIVIGVDEVKLVRASVGTCQRQAIVSRAGAYAHHVADVITSITSKGNALPLRRCRTATDRYPRAGKVHAII